MKTPTMEELNEAALTLRESIDKTFDELADSFSVTQAEISTRPLYDAVTRLHEVATAHVRGTP